MRPGDAVVDDSGLTMLAAPGLARPGGESARRTCEIAVTCFHGRGPDSSHEDGAWPPPGLGSDMRLEAVALKGIGTSRSTGVWCKEGE